MCKSLHTDQKMSLQRCYTMDERLKFVARLLLDDPTDRSRRPSFNAHSRVALRPPLPLRNAVSS
jgi:hypothetical protein